MSRKAADWAWKTPAKGTARLLLLALGDFADPGGWVWAQLPALAERAGVGEATVKRQLPRLEEAGLISVLRRRGRGVSLICQVLFPGHDTRDAKTAHPELFKTGRSDAPDARHGASNTAHSEPLSDRKTAHSDAKTAHPVSKNSSSSSIAPYIGPIKEPVSYPTTSAPARAADARPMALVPAHDGAPSVADVRAAESLIDEVVGVQPRLAAHQLSTHLADSIHRGIPAPVIRQALTEWVGTGYSPNALPSFISRVQRSSRPGVFRSTTDQRVAQGQALVDLYPEEGA